MQKFYIFQKILYAGHKRLRSQKEKTKNFWQLSGQWFAGYFQSVCVLIVECCLLSLYCELFCIIIVIVESYSHI